MEIMERTGPLPPRTGPLAASSGLFLEPGGYPRHIRETEFEQHLHRTAAVKHHLRKMAARSEMLSTYERLVIMVIHMLILVLIR